MPTALIELNKRIKPKLCKMCVALLFCAFTAFMVVCRILSGVHWISDIIGGALLSAGLVAMYYYVIGLDLK
jgi:undecaprenyl-diphosphatase